MTKGTTKSKSLQRGDGCFPSYALILVVVVALLFIAKYGDAVDNVGSRMHDRLDESTFRSSEDEGVVEKKILIKDAAVNANEDAHLLLTEDDVDKFDDYFVDDHEGLEEDDVEMDDDDSYDEELEEDYDIDDLWLFQYDPVEVGHVQDIEVEDGTMLKMTTLAVNPPIFEIKNFLSDEECDHVMALAVKKGLQTSLTVPEKPELSEEEKDDARLYFGELDENGDDFLNGSELYEAIKMFTHAQHFNLTTGHVEELIRVKLDQDGDGLLDVEEFIDADTPAMEEEIDHWLVVIGDLGDKEVVRSKPRVSEQAWLDQWTTEDEVLLRLQDRVISLTLLPSAIIQTSEHLQVVRYEPGGHYHAHYDSDELDDDLECSHTFGIEDDDDERKYRYSGDFSQKRLCRLATVLYYLNDVEEGGGTAFPVADNETFTEESLDDLTYDIYDLSKHCQKSNVVVPPERGKAILWYNHYLDEEMGWIGANRNHSLHGGCDVIKGTKWIANNWITVDDNVDRQIMFHERYYSQLDEQFGEHRYSFTPSPEPESLPEDDGVSTEDQTKINDRLQSGNDDAIPKDDNYGSENGHSRRTNEQSNFKRDADLHSEENRVQKEEKLDNLSHHKAREKLDDNRQPNLFSSSRESGSEFKRNDEL